MLFGRPESSIPTFWNRALIGGLSNWRPSLTHPRKQPSTTPSQGEAVPDQRPSQFLPARPAGRCKVLAVEVHLSRSPEARNPLASIQTCRRRRLANGLRTHARCLVDEMGFMALRDEQNEALRAQDEALREQHRNAFADVAKDWHAHLEDQPDRTSCRLCVATDHTPRLGSPKVSRSRGPASEREI